MVNHRNCTRIKHVKEPMTESRGHLVTIAQLANHFRMSRIMAKNLVAEGRIEAIGKPGVAYTRYNLDTYRDTPDSPPRGEIEGTTRYVRSSEASRHLGMKPSQFSEWARRHSRFIIVGKQDNRIVEWTDEMEEKCLALGNPSPFTPEDPILTTSELLSYLAISRRQLNDIVAASCIVKIPGPTDTAACKFPMNSLRSSPAGPFVPYDPDACWMSAKEAPLEFGVDTFQFDNWVQQGKIKTMVIGGISLPRYDVYSFVPGPEDHVITPVELREDEATVELRTWRARIRETPTTLPEALKRVKVLEHDHYGDLKKIQEMRKEIRNLENELKILTASLQEEKRLRHEEKRQIDATRISMAEQQAVLANSCLLGAYGERECKPIYERAFNAWGKINHVSGTPHSGDFNQHGPGFMVIHELKYGKTLISNKQGIEKLMTDIIASETRSGLPCIGATLVSWNAEIANRHVVPITTTLAPNGRTLIVCISNMEKIIAGGSRYVDVLRHAYDLIMEHQKTIRRSIYFSSVMTLHRKREGSLPLLLSQISETTGIDKSSPLIKAMVVTVVQMTEQVKDMDGEEIIGNLKEIIEKRVDDELKEGIKYKEEVVFTPQIADRDSSRSRSRSRSRSVRQVRIADAAVVSDGTVRRMAEPASEEE